MPAALVDRAAEAGEVTVAGAPSNTQEAGEAATARHMIDVFISHGSEDADLARQIRSHLESGGFRCWMAPDDVTGPESWAEQIVDAIQGCRVMLILISDQANRSQHVSKEVDLAMDAGKPLLPVRVEDVVPTGALQYLLALAQWVDAFPGSVDKHVAAVKSRIVAILGDETTRTTDAAEPPIPRRAPAETPAPAPIPEAAPDRASRLGRLPAWAPWVGGALAAVVVVVAVIAVMSRGNGGEATTTTVAATVDVPFAYGDDAGLDGLWDECAGGARVACDSLAVDAPFGSEYREFGATCGFLAGGCAGLDTGQTTPPGDERDALRVNCEQGDPAACLELYETAGAGSDDELLAITCGYGAGNCAEQFGEPYTYGDDPYFDQLWEACSIGEAPACRELFNNSPIDSIYEHYGYICGRPDAGCDGLGEPDDFLPTAMLDQLYGECQAGVLEACGELVLRAPPDSFYAEDGLTCFGIDGGCSGLFGGAASVGDHDYLDSLWMHCVEGSAPHCNLLWWWSPSGSDYEWFAEVCAEPAAAGLPCEAAIP
jgi:hypothetical protein